MRSGRPLSLLSALGAAMLAALIAAPGAGAMSLRTPAGTLDPSRFDVWTGIWEWQAPQGAKPSWLVLRKRFDGSLVGIVWKTSAKPPDPQTLDPEFPDFVGVVDEDTGVEAAGLLLGEGGETQVVLKTGVATYRTLRLFYSEASSELYEYVGGGSDRLALDLDWKRRTVRGGQYVQDVVRVGDTVDLFFSLTNQGPRGLEPGLVQLVVVFPKALQKQARTIRHGNHLAKCKKHATPNSTYITCTLSAVGPFYVTDVSPDRMSTNLRLTIPAAFLGKTIKISFRLSLAKKGLDPPLDVFASPREASMSFKVHKKKTGGGSGGGGSGGGGSEPTTRTFYSPRGTVTVPSTGKTGSGLILWPQALYTPSQAANEYCKHVDNDGEYTMDGVSDFTKATAWDNESGNGRFAVGLIVWELVSEPVEVFKFITCST